MSLPSPPPSPPVSPFSSSSSCLSLWSHYCCCSCCCCCCQGTLAALGSLIVSTNSKTVYRRAWTLPLFPALVRLLASIALRSSSLASAMPSFVVPPRSPSASEPSSHAPQFPTAIHCGLPFAWFPTVEASTSNSDAMGPCVHNAVVCLAWLSGLLGPSGISPLTLAGASGLAGLTGAGDGGLLVGALTESQVGARHVFLPPPLPLSPHANPTKACHPIV